MHVAAKVGNFHTISLIVDKIESIDFERSLYTGPDELVRAVRQRERLKSLINERDRFGYTPLQYTAKNSKWDIVNLFLDKTAERGPDDVITKDRFSTSWTTVHYAVYNGDLNLIRDVFHFLSNKDAVINTKDSSGWAPLHYAVSYGALDVVRFLVDEGANIGAKDKDKKTPLDVAKYNGNQSIANFFEKKQDEYNSLLLNAVKRNDFGEIIVFLNRGANIEVKGVKNAAFKLAYYVKGIMEMSNYHDVHSEKRSELEVIKRELPESVKNAVFSSKVCIKNVHWNEYLYAASYDPYDNDRRRVFTWRTGEKDNQSVWEVGPDGNNSYIRSTYFNEFLYAASYDPYDNNRRRVFTWRPGEKDNQSVWEIRPDGNMVYIKSVYFDEYLYAADDYFSYDNDRRRVFTWRPGVSIEGEKGVWKIEDCGDVRKKRDIQELDSKVSLGSDSLKARSKLNSTQILSLSGRLNDKVGYTKEEATNGASKPFSPMGAFIGTIGGAIVDSIKGAFQLISSPFRASLPLTSENSSNHSDKIRNPSNQYTGQFGSEVCMSNNVALGFFLLQNFLDKKYPLPKSCSITPEEALTNTLNITEKFGQILRETAKQSRISVKGFDFFTVYLNVADHVRNERYSQIPTTLYSAAKDAYPKNERFLSILKGNIEKMLDRQRIVSSSNQEQSTANKTPPSSLNSIAVEPANNKSLKGVTCAGRVA